MMNKTLLALCILLICSFQRKDVNQHKPQDKNILVVKQLFEFFNRHEWKKMVDLYKPETLFLDPSLGILPVTQTRQQTIDKYTGFEKYSPDIKDSILQIYTSGNHVIAEYVASGTPANGKKWSLPICSVFTLEDGLITRDNTYYDHTP